MHSKHAQSGGQQRRFARRAIHCPAGLTLGGRDYESGEVVEISEGGFLIKLSCRIAEKIYLGTQLSIHFVLPSGVFMTNAVEARYSAQRNGSRAFVFLGMKFVVISEDERLSIARYVAGDSCAD